MAKTNIPSTSRTSPTLSRELSRVLAPGGGKGVRPAPSTAKKFSVPVPKK